jgi:hypothetical protein
LGNEFELVRFCEKSWLLMFDNHSMRYEIGGNRVVLLAR